MTAYERKTGWKYSITCANIPHTGIGEVPGSQHPQFIDVLHRDHATVETDGVRTAKAMGLRNLPEGLAGQQGLGPRREHRRRPHRLGPPPRPPRPARPAGRRAGHAPLPNLAPAGPPGPPRPEAEPEDQPGLAMERRVHHLLEPVLRPARTRLTSANHPDDTKGDAFRPRGSRCRPGHAGQHPTPPARTETDMKLKNRPQHKQ
jgi:hypothetical protein